MNMETETTQTLSDPWTDIQPILVGKVPAAQGSPFQYVQVSDHGKPSLRIDCYRDSEQAYVSEDTIVWADWLVLGRGHHVVLVNLDTHLVRDTDLGSYFSSAWIDEEFLLICSGQQIFKLDRHANILWTSPQVGIDGVVIKRLDNGMIFGQADQDPPGGWQPFQLSLLRGDLT